MYDYFYGDQAEQFSFYRVPKIMFTNDRFKGLSTEAKVLYGILMDRACLSKKNGWLDNHQRVYIIYTVEEAMTDMNCGNKKAIQILKELEEKAGLIERKRQGLGKPNLIYVKNFVNPVDNSAGGHFQKCQNDISGSVKTTSPEVSKSHGNNTDISNTEYSDTDPILSNDGWDTDGMSEREQMEDYFRSTLYVEYLLQDNPHDAETIEGIVDLLVDTCCSKRKTVRIAGDDKPKEVVKSRLMKLEKDHIEYVLHCLSQNTSEVRNIRQYLLATLYNAPTTISPYYQALVNNDMANGRI